MKDSGIVAPLAMEFDFQDAQPSPQRNVKHRAAKEVTFKGGRDRLAHRWFRLTPSFSPYLVGEILDRYGTSESKVLDPFSGRGTTPIECQLRGIECVGAEINPALHFAATVSIDWTVDAATLGELFQATISRSRVLREKFSSHSAEEVASHFSLAIPTIHNVYRWWRSDVLRDLLLVKMAITDCKCEPAYERKMLLALTSILLDAANITLGRLQLHFVDRADEHIDALRLFEGAAQAITHDLRELNRFDSAKKAEVLLTDNRNLASSIGSYRADVVITSPPYPNRYSYVWNTRPHLYFMEWCATPGDASKLDCQTIGGTWGTATSRHQKGFHSFVNAQAELVTRHTVEEIRAKDLLMSNYVAMYFDDLYSSILETRRCLSENAVCAYVVGNSRAKGSIVQTDALLADLFQEAGFSLIGIEEVRRRNSGKELHESIVFARHGN